MADFSQIVDTLRAQEQELESQLMKVRAAREALESATGTAAVTPMSAPAPARRGRRLGRPPGTAKRRPGRPQKNAAASAGAANSAKRRRRRKFSAETRAKMAAAQRARWAKVKTQQGKK